MGDQRPPKFSLYNDFECGPDCQAGFKKVVIILPLRCWIKENLPVWTHSVFYSDNGKSDQNKTHCGILCKNDHFIEDAEAEWKVTEGNRNGNRGRQYIRGMAASFTHFPLDYDDEFFMCFTDTIILRMINEGYYDPRDEEVIALQRNVYAADDILKDAGEANDAMSEISSKWAVSGETLFSSITKVDEWRQQNPNKPLPSAGSPNRRLRAGIPGVREQELKPGNSGNIMEKPVHPQNELSLLSDFPVNNSVGASSQSSAISQQDTPERSSTPKLNAQTRTISEKTDSHCAGYCNCNICPQKAQKMTSSSQNSSTRDQELDDLKRQVQDLENWQKRAKEDEHFISKASNWFKNNSEVHVALTLALAAYIILDRKKTIVAIFK